MSEEDICIDCPHYLGLEYGCNPPAGECDYQLAKAEQQEETEEANNA